MDILREAYPGADPEDPAWRLVKADLVDAGYGRAELNRTEAPSLLRLLRRAPSGRAAAVLAAPPAQGQNAEGSAKAGDGAGRPTGSGDTSAKADRRIARDWVKWRDAQHKEGNHTASFAQYAEQKCRAELAKMDPKKRPAAVKQYASKVRAAVDRDRKRRAGKVKRTSK